MSTTRSKRVEQPSTVPALGKVEPEVQGAIKVRDTEDRFESLARALAEIEKITDDSDELIDWEEAECDLDSFRPERKLFSK